MSLQSRSRKLAKERNAGKKETFFQRKAREAKEGPMRVIGGDTPSSRRTMEKKLKKKGMTDKEIKKVMKQKPEQKNLYKQRIVKKNTTPAPKPGKPTNTKMGPNMSKVNKPAPKPGKPTNTKIGPDMSKVNKPTPKPTPKPAQRKGPSGPTMTSMKAPSTGPKPRNKDEKVDLKKRGPSRPSMTGFKHGGKVRGDGICRKGKTKGRMV